MRKIIFTFKFFGFMFITFVLVISGLYLYAYITPKLELKSANKIVLYDINNNAFFENVPGSRWVKLEDISDYVIDATIATEDKNYYSHHGFDYLRIMKALYHDVKHRSLNQGASTISQQYIKNLYLTFDKTWARKIEEAFLTLELEVHYDKDDILEGYLNTINYGSGNYGIENASNYYFNKKASELSLAEASILVGIPKNPTMYNPIINYENAKKRQKLVLLSMVNNNYISEEELKNIFEEKLVFYGTKEDRVLSSINYYSNAVMQELDSLNVIPKSLIETGGINIYTNLDVEMQEGLENIIKEEMADQDNYQVASMIIEPSTGKIKALIGGYDYTISQFNRATQAKRQVGSTFKTILYYAALENGFTASSTFLSEATTFNIDNGKIYAPRNYGDKYANKDITLASAIALSDNIYAVKTHLFLGENLLIDAAKRMGITALLQNNVSLALGTNEISMIDYSNAFNTLANYGIKNDNYLISKVTDSKGNILYEHKYKEEQVLNRRYVYILNEMLSNTYNYSFVDYTSPTMLPVSNLLTNKYAIKSGTTLNDFWVIGYNPESLVLVWNGYDDNTEVKPSQSKITKTIWARTIEMSLNGKKTTWYDIPEGVNAALVNPVSGEIDNSGKSSLLYYVKGTEPFINNNMFNNVFLNN